MSLVCIPLYSKRTASYPDVSLSMKMCAQRKMGRRQRARRRFTCRLYPSHGPLRFITSHSRFALASTMRKTKRLRRRLAKEHMTAGSTATTATGWELLCISSSLAGNGGSMAQFSPLGYSDIIFPQTSPKNDSFFKVRALLHTRLRSLGLFGFSHCMLTSSAISNWTETREKWRQSVKDSEVKPLPHPLC